VAQYLPKSAKSGSAAGRTQLLVCFCRTEGKGIAWSGGGRGRGCLRAWDPTKSNAVGGEGCLPGPSKDDAGEGLTLTSGAALPVAQTLEHHVKKRERWEGAIEDILLKGVSSAHRYEVRLTRRSSFPLKENIHVREPQEFLTIADHGSTNVGNAYSCSLKTRSHG